MKLERIISEYENELASLKMSLKKSKDLTRKMEISAEIDEIEQIIIDLKEQKFDKEKYNE